jgi:hypothetical protein
MSLNYNSDYEAFQQEFSGNGNQGSQSNDFYNFPINLQCRSSKSVSYNYPAVQYQIQKVIQNTVRVPASLYVDNLGALSVYQSPLPNYYVNWNQMSDRKEPHKQTNSGNSQGSFYHGSSRRHTQTGSRPGSTTPGGIGVDIKHNSYHRYLSRLKGSKPLRRGVIPPTFGIPEPFVPSVPIYGNKTVKTSIVNNCNSCTCPNSVIDCNNVTAKENATIYKLNDVNNINSYNAAINYTGNYSPGEHAYTFYPNTQSFVQVTILDFLGNNEYLVQFPDFLFSILSKNKLIPLNQTICYKCNK